MPRLNVGCIFTLRSFVNLPSIAAQAIASCVTFFKFEILRLYLCIYNINYEIDERLLIFNIKYTVRIYHLHSFKIARINNYLFSRVIKKFNIVHTYCSVISHYIFGLHKHYHYTFIVNNWIIDGMHQLVFNITRSIHERN